jgi:hypothetical protein
MLIRGCIRPEAQLFAYKSNALLGKRSFRYNQISQQWPWEASLILAAFLDKPVTLYRADSPDPRYTRLPAT